MTAMTIAAEQMRAFIVGDIIQVDGRNYRIDKKTCTAIAVSRYFWFDALYDKIRSMARRVMGAR